MKFKSILGKGEKVSIENIQSDFVTLASHQLRTPLSAVKWNTEILLGQKRGRLNQKQLGYLQEIYRSNERAINLVNDLLDVSRIEEGRLHLEYRLTKVEEIIEEVLSNLSTSLKAHRIGINFEIINGPLPKIETDREKLKRVVTNLLTNSIRYTPNPGKIKVTIEREQNRIKVSITDFGVGISKSDSAGIFKKFFRSPRVIKVAPDGTGLGLYITKSLVEAMGGKIGFYSAEDKGATFFFTLPIKS